MKIKRRLTIVSLSILVLFSISLISAATCSDTDNGKNYYDYGTTCISGGSCYPDKCIGSTLKEFYCGDDGKVALALFPCSFCSGGKCACIDYYADADSDGYGDVSNKKCLYAVEGNYKVTQTGDCNDGNPNINSGKTETCNDGIDNDCDLIVDEGCTATGTTNEGTTDGGTTTNEESPSGSVTPPTDGGAFGGPNARTTSGNELTPGEGGGGGSSCDTTSTGIRLTGPTWKSSGTELTDTCLDSITGTDQIIDYSCNGAEYIREIKNCPYGCPYGNHACNPAPGVPQVCADTCTSSESCGNWINTQTKCCAEQCTTTPSTQTVANPCPGTDIACGFDSTTNKCTDCTAIHGGDLCWAGNIWQRTTRCTANQECGWPAFVNTKTETCAYGCRNSWKEGVNSAKCNAGFPENYGCTFNSQCISGRCIQSECGLRENGESCIFNVDCISNKCRGGFLMFGNTCRT